MYYTTNKDKISSNLNNLQKYYEDFSKRKENTQKIFVENIERIDNNGEVKKLSYDFVENSKDYYLNIVQRTTYLQNKIISEDTNKIGIFITLTLPTEYHPFKNKNTIINDKYNKEYSINKGYQLLNDMFRKIQKDFRSNGKTKQALKFVKIVEYHKSLVPHLHGLVWIDKEDLKMFKKHLYNIFGTVEHIELSKKSNENIIVHKHYENDNYIKTTTKTTKSKEFKKYHNVNSKIEKIKYTDNKNIGRSEIEIIEDTTRVVPYLLKYIKKSFTTDFHLFNGWKKKNRIRVFTMSNVSIPRFIHRKLYNHLGKFIDKKENYNILEELENITDINVNYFQEDKTIKSKKYGNNGRYEVIVDIEIIDKVKYTNNITDYKMSWKKTDFIYDFVLRDKLFFEDNRYEEIENEEDRNRIKMFINNKDNNNNEIHIKKMNEWCESENIYKVDRILSREDLKQYRVDLFLIIDKETNKIIYNSKDFKYINNN